MNDCRYRFQASARSARNNSGRLSVAKLVTKIVNRRHEQKQRAIGDCTDLIRALPLA